MKKELKIMIKKVPLDFNCSIRGYNKLINWINPKFINSFKDFTDEDISDMIRNENRLARRRY